MAYRLVNIFFVISLAVASPSLSQTAASKYVRQSASAVKQSENACSDATFTVDSQPDAPISLAVIEAGCDGPHFWKAQLNLMNTSDRLIRGYKIASISTYEHKKGVWTSQGRSGAELKPDDSVKVPFKAGFRDGLSYGRPVGRLQKIAFRVELIEFSDGTYWKFDSSK